MLLTKLIIILASALIMETVWSFFKKNMPYTNTTALKIVKIINILALATIDYNIITSNILIINIISSVVILGYIIAHSIIIRLQHNTWPKENHMWLLVNSIASVAIEAVLLILIAVHICQQTQASV